jgi:uncharacterized oxidoreductase
MAEFKGLVVITGASRGIGGALVRKFDEAGYPVLAVARTPAEAQESGTVATLAADLTRQTGLAQVMAAVRARGIPVAALINNAGVQNALGLAAAGPDRCGAPDADPVGREIALNLTAPIRLSRGLVPLMRQPGGTIVNVTSLVSRHPKPSAPVYSATKAGLASFTESLRHQVAPLGIHVIEAVPPLVDTAMTAGRDTGKISPEAMADAIFVGMMQGRSLVATGIARRVLLLNRLLPGLVRRILSRA